MQITIPGSDPFAKLKEAQKQSWGLFIPLEAVTTEPAAELIQFAQIKAGEEVLDIGTGTGVAAITAARRGAKVSALDLSPRLLKRAHENASIAQVQVNFIEGDAEALPYEDASFDVVTSQFGHMFAPRPEFAIREMYRVLKPGGKLAFSTWPPHLFAGRMFNLVSRFVPPPEGVVSPTLWGDPAIVKERLGAHFSNLVFSTGLLRFPALSPAHYRTSVEGTLAPVVKLIEAAGENSPQVSQFRSEFEDLISKYFDGNCVKQHYLMTQAIKAGSQSH